VKPRGRPLLRDRIRSTIGSIDFPVLCASRRIFYGAAAAVLSQPMALNSGSARQLVIASAISSIAGSRQRQRYCSRFVIIVHGRGHPDPGQMIGLLQLNGFQEATTAPGVMKTRMPRHRIAGFQGVPGAPCQLAGDCERDSDIPSLRASK